MFRIEMLPAEHGDALWIEYGSSDDLHRVLIDGGTFGTYRHLRARLDQVTLGPRRFELIVLTHVDADHIEGLLRLFSDNPMLFQVDKMFFNGWQQMMPRGGLLGALQGEFLSALLHKRAPLAWRVDGPPLVVPASGRLPVHTLPGGMRLTLLSPTMPRLEAMADEWRKSLQKAGVVPGDLEMAWKLYSKRKQFHPKTGLLDGGSAIDRLLDEEFMPDHAAANGSSIAFLAEYRGKSALLLGDAHPDVVTSSLRRLCRERRVRRLRVNALKLAHHGSKRNTNASLLAMIECERYLVSTDGSRFRHPDRSCIAHVIRFGGAKEIVFNYRSEFTRPWCLLGTQKRYGYAARVRHEEDVSIAIEL